jgi:ATP-dependent helicase/nuclease subunit B
MGGTDQDIPEAMPAAARCRLPASADFVAQCAHLIVAARKQQLPDLSDCLVVIPNPAVAPELRAALAGAAGRALLLPRIATLSQLAQAALEPGGAQPDSLRQLVLYRELKARGWFADGALWELCAELTALFDELSERSVGLPRDEAAFLARLEDAYGVRASQPLRFEAQVVHALWRAEAAGAPSRSTAAILALARQAGSAAAPLFVLCESEPGPTEAAFFDAWAGRQPATVFIPQRALAETALMRVLNLAWPPGESAAPLAQRADEAVAMLPESPLAGRLRLIGAASLEEEARAVAAEVRRWLASGKRRIALVAADRVAARRARALLEREGILVEDETGWKLSTTRAAALVDAWLEVIAADAYHRDLLDLVKSPFVFADLSADARQAAVLQLEAGIARHNLAAGLRRYETALAQEPGGEAALAVIRRVAGARGRMPRGAAPLADWLYRLEQALEELGALPGLAADEAGATLLELIRSRREELAGESLRVGFGEWREWLNRELECAAFVDRSIGSPVRMTHLAAIRLRAFDAAIVIGADREHLAPAASTAVFSHQGVRAELGLPTFTEAAARLRDDLAFLLAASGEVTATWQVLRENEANLLCPELAALSLLHRRAWKDTLRHPVPPAQGQALAGPAGTPLPAPALPRERVPLRVSASGYASLVACPYQFFARRVLGLAEAEEVREELEKRDYGEFVHRILNRFHARHARLEGQAEAVLADELAAITAAEFKAVTDKRFLDQAWPARWRSRIPSYIAWQLGREKDGWHYAGGELARETRLALDDGAGLTLHGRLDRLDHSGGEAQAVLDYKAQRKKKLSDRVGDADDVQLAVYALLQGEAVTDAAYVALDEEKVAAVALSDPQRAARAQQERLVRTFSALRAGAAMPAHGIDSVCAWCEMRGLCRKDYRSGDGA